MLGWHLHSNTRRHIQQHYNKSIIHPVATLFYTKISTCVCSKPEYNKRNKIIFSSSSSRGIQIHNGIARRSFCSFHSCTIIISAAQLWNNYFLDLSHTVERIVTKFQSLVAYCYAKSLHVFVLLSMNARIEKRAGCLRSLFTGTASCWWHWLTWIFWWKMIKSIVPEGILINRAFPIPHYHIILPLQ